MNKSVHKSLWTVWNGDEDMMSFTEIVKVARKAFRKNHRTGSFPASSEQQEEHRRGRRMRQPRQCEEEDQELDMHLLAHGVVFAFPHDRSPH
jgi:hypothetical protein